VGAVAQIHGDHDQKLVMVATAKLLTELPLLQTPDNVTLWGGALNAMLGALEGGDGSPSQEEVVEAEEYAGEAGTGSRQLKGSSGKVAEFCVEHTSGPYFPHAGDFLVWCIMLLFSFVEERGLQGQQEGSCKNGLVHEI
jgi:hypothetical protein